MDSKVVAFLAATVCVGLVAAQGPICDKNGQCGYSCGNDANNPMSLFCDTRPGSCGSGQMPWGQGTYRGCIRCPYGYGLMPIVPGDPTVIMCVKCSDKGIYNCEKCCHPNGSKFCGEAYKSYGCCDWCTQTGFDNPPTHGVCYPTGTSPVKDSSSDPRAFAGTPNGPSGTTALSATVATNTATTRSTAAAPSPL